MMVTMSFEEAMKPLTEEELRMLDELDKMPIVYDEDCPKQTEEQLKQFKRVNPRQRSTPA